MKLRSDLQTIEAFGTIATWSYNLRFENILMQTWMRKVLQSLILKLSRAKDRISKALTLQAARKPAKPTKPRLLTLTFNDAEALALFYICEIYIEQHPATLETLIAQKEIISPLQQLQV